MRWIDKRQVEGPVLGRLGLVPVRQLLGFTLQLLRKRGFSVSGMSTPPGSRSGGAGRAMALEWAARCGHISMVISTVLNAYYASFADVAGPARMGAH